MVVPTAAFVPERRNSIPSSDSELHPRKQKSPQRRKKRRKTSTTESESRLQDESVPLAPEDSQDDVSSAADSAHHVQDDLPSASGTQQRSEDPDADASRETKKDTGMRAATRVSTMTGTAPVSWGDEVPPDEEMPQDGPENRA